MATPFYLDAISIIGRFEAGGIKGLEAISSWARPCDLRMVVTDMAHFELDKLGTSGAPLELVPGIEIVPR